MCGLRGLSILKFKRIKLDLFNDKNFDLKKKIIAAIVVSVVFSVMSALLNQHDKAVMSTLTRPEPGETDEIKQIKVLDKKGEVLAQLNVNIEPRQLSENEIFEYFDNAFEEIKTKMLKENTNLNHVTSDLNLCDTAQNGVVELEWYSTDYELVGYDGKVNNRGFSDSDERRVKLVLITKYGEYRKEYDIEVNITAPQYDSYTRIKVHAEDGIKQAADSNPESSDIKLPEYIDGQAVDYEYGNETNSPVVFIGLGGVAVILIILMDKKKSKDAADKRKKELVYDYSEIVSKLTLLLGAGMTTRMAWHKIADDYNRKKQNEGFILRPAYEEMYETDCNMQAGISEGIAYERFGKRCDTREYMKLASLLQTNLRKGTSHIRELLEVEVNEAFEKRKNLAKIKGEEATTKLLFPMLLMLVVVMAIIMIPAVMKFRM